MGEGGFPRLDIDWSIKRGGLRRTNFQDDMTQPRVWVLVGGGCWIKLQSDAEPRHIQQTGVKGKFVKLAGMSVYADIGIISVADSRLAVLLDTDALILLALTAAAAAGLKIY